MDFITLPRLRLNQLQTVAESSLEICDGLTGTGPSREKVTIALTAFKEGMLKVQAFGGDKKSLDMDRDQLISGFFMDVKAEMLFPHEDESVISALKELMKTINKYGAGIRRLPLDDETAAVDNMVADVEKLDLAPLANMGLNRWNPLIKNANNAFKTAAKEYIEDSALAAELEAAGKLAPALVDALEGMYAMVMANLMVAHEGPFQKAYAELQELVGSFR